MASEANLVKEPGLKSAGNLTAAANQFRAVKLDANGDVVLCGAGEKCFGVLYNKPNTGEAAEVVVAGSPKVALGGTVNEDDSLTPDASGDFVAVTAGVGNTDYSFAQAKDAGASGEIISALITRTGIENTAVS